ncbi:hypothetical protein K469DRAFT_688417 [Zopfia rhizophila CBS 207.26]|uniref:Peptidase A2 domain-containing protein n=1 Tax=Zopfia rhizophila CBS 207.26 TaxID=1314779 RepID=A0A6A6E3T1_9PEZI|nr:hypothetical protein K469DRAFT_688417 [Zopfia rhizophila CBS 207.26]
MSRLRSFIAESTTEAQNALRDSYNNVTELRDRLGSVEEEYERAAEDLDMLEWEYLNKESVYFDTSAGASTRATAANYYDMTPWDWSSDLRIISPVLQGSSSLSPDDSLHSFQYPRSPASSLPYTLNPDLLPQPPSLRSDELHSHIEDLHIDSQSPSSNGATKVFEIPSLLGNRLINALGDYGAKKNFMKEEFAIRLGLKINCHTLCNIAVGSGKKVPTSGTAKCRFRFKNEDEVHNLKFHLLPNCIHDVILGKRFLRATETFSKATNFARRVKERFMKGISRFDFLYLGDSAPRFQVLINGKPQDALADSGSKVLIMDEAYARLMGFTIVRKKKWRRRLRFADNTTANTCGKVYRVRLQFGQISEESSSPYTLNFYIMKKAPASVILCDTFLFENEAFSRYNQHLVDDDDDEVDDDEDDGHFFAIDIDPTITTNRADPNYVELVRRGQEDDHIENLPVGEQDAARFLEDERRALWEQEFEKQQSSPAQAPEQQQLISPSPISLSTSTSSQAQSSTPQNTSPNSHQQQSSSSPRRKRSKWRTKWKFPSFP